MTQTNEQVINEETQAVICTLNSIEEWHKVRQSVAVMLNIPPRADDGPKTLADYAAQAHNFVCVMAVHHVGQVPSTIHHENVDWEHIALLLIEEGKELMRDPSQYINR